MTNAELIQTICKEIISRLDKRHLSAQAQNELVSLLSFLSTLESETKKDEKVPSRIYLGSKYEFIRRDIILKEIEGLKKNNEVSDDKEYASYELDVACGYDMACDDILSFLKPFAEVDKHPKNILDPSKECEPGLREPLESEKPVPADLEEAADNHIREVADAAGHPGWDWETQDIADAFIAGAKWQADHTPLPEDTVLFNKGVEEGKRLMMDEWLKDRDGCFWDGVEEGKKAMKEQMLKDAVRWLVDDDYDPQTDKGRFILGSVGIGYNGYYIPYSDLLKLPKEDEK